MLVAYLGADVHCVDSWLLPGCELVSHQHPCSLVPAFPYIPLFIGLSLIEKSDTAKADVLLHILCVDMEENMNFLYGTVAGHARCRCYLSPQYGSEKRLLRKTIPRYEFNLPVSLSFFGTHD